MPFIPKTLAPALRHRHSSDQLLVFGLSALSFFALLYNQNITNGRKNEVSNIALLA
jgi:hypothetical protein